MARLGAKVSQSEVSSFPKNTFSVWIFWRNRPHTSFLRLIGNMVRSGAKLFRTKTLLNFASQALSNSFFQKNTFSVWIFVLNRTPPLFLAKRTRCAIRGKSVPQRSFILPKKHVFSWIFLMKPASYHFSGPNWLHGAFGGKIVPDLHCSILPQKPYRIRFSKKHVFGLNFCTKSPFTNFLGLTD